MALMEESEEHLHLSSKYGPWALITGASDGTGAAFARQIAAHGINLIMVARREPPLSALAQSLTHEYGIETRIASIDLYDDSATQQVIETAAGLDVGLFIANAGSDPNGSQCLDAPFKAWQDMLNRNVLNVTGCAYYFAGGMRERGRGGIVIVSSASALAGQPGGAVYSGTKAFQLNFCESLWSELRDSGVDVLCAVCAAMDTPSLRNLLESHGLDAPPLLPPEDVVSELLSELGKKPVHISPYMGNDDQVAAIEKDRYERLMFMEKISKSFYG
jgi:short-subunit dehydrogenase